MPRAKTRRKPLDPHIRDVIKQIVKPAMARIQESCAERLTVPIFLEYAVSYYEHQFKRYGGIYIPPRLRKTFGSGLIPETEWILRHRLVRAQKTIDEMKAGLDSMLAPYYHYHAHETNEIIPEDDRPKEIAPLQKKCPLTLIKSDNATISEQEGTS